MNVTIFQKDKECFLWTQSELESIEENSRTLMKLHATMPYEFDLNGHHIKVYTDRCGGASQGKLDREVLGDVNIIVLYGGMDDEWIKRLLARIKALSDYKFVLIAKHTEDYFLSTTCMQRDDFLLEVSSITNIRVLWDVPIYDYPGFVFNPKMLYHNYHNQDAFHGGNIFEYAHNVFKMIPNKKYRVGYHTNKVTNLLRRALYDFLKDEYSNPNLFFTNSRSFKGHIFNPMIRPLREGGTSGYWYTYQFLEQTIYSQMEIVYETSTLAAPYAYLHKWTEKTIKHLFLGKPFIHTDPIAHSLMKVYGLESYDTLYTPALLAFFNETHYTDRIDLNSECRLDTNKWFSLVKENIKWLCELTDDEFGWRISQANEAAERNRVRINNLIYHTSILSQITTEEFWKD